MKLIAIVLPILLLTSCLKSTEDLRREKVVDQLEAQMKDRQALLADMTAKFEEFEERVAQVNGQIEAIEYKQKNLEEQQQQKLVETLKQLKEQMGNMQNTIDEQNKTIASLKAELQTQQSYVKKVTKTLSGISKSTSYKPTLQKALGHINKGRYKKAKPLLEELLAEKLSAADRNKVYHGLGLVKFNAKLYDESITYFSKIVTKWPKSSLTPNSFLFIGKSFKAQGKTDEAKATFDALIKNYPKSKVVSTAKSELKSL